MELTPHCLFPCGVRWDLLTQQQCGIAFGGEEPQFWGLTAQVQTLPLTTCVILRKLLSYRDDNKSTLAVELS